MKRMFLMMSMVSLLVSQMSYSQLSQEEVGKAVTLGFGATCLGYRAIRAGGLPALGRVGAILTCTAGLTCFVTKGLIPSIREPHR